MVNWQVTATTIYCDAVADEVTVLVYKDGTAKCTGYTKYGELGREGRVRLKKRSRELKRNIDCRGQGCSLVARYRDKLLAEERNR
jgi:hypothetical protein